MTGRIADPLRTMIGIIDLFARGGITVILCVDCHRPPELAFLAYKNA